MAVLVNKDSKVIVQGFTGTPVLNYDGQGNNFTPVYAAPDALIRFGFSWALIN